MDPSRILNVPPDADNATITKAFRKMALKYHPDKAGDSSKIKFQHVGLAYEILMAKTDQNGKSSATHRNAGMSAEDAAHIKNTQVQQEKQHDSFTFSSERHSSSSDSEESSLLEECPVCGGPCSVPEFIAR
jgi:DnaJ-class molecular chaperone